MTIEALPTDRQGNGGTLRLVSQAKRLNFPQISEMLRAHSVEKINPIKAKNNE